MNYYEHHLGDWAKKCSHLTLAEEGAYRRLLDWYYTNERPLPLELRTVRRIARCTTSTEKRVVDKVLLEFFEPMDDGYHQHRVDRELEVFQKRLPVTLAAKENMRDRAQRAREKRSLLFQALNAHGLDAPWNTKNDTLLELLQEHGIEAPRTAPRTAQGTAQVTASHLPSTSNTGVSSGKPLDVLVTTEARAIAARAMKKTGFFAVNPLDPRFIRLLAEGCTVDEFRHVAAEAAAKEKGWAWLLATLKGRREDVARMTQQGPQTARQRADEARLREWAPQLLATPPRA